MDTLISTYSPLDVPPGLLVGLFNELDVAVIFSQDQDLSEVADELRVIAQEQDRWIKVASAFPVSKNSTNVRGINKTDWIKIKQSLYDQCLDSRDYRKNNKKH